MSPSTTTSTHSSPTSTRSAGEICTPSTCNGSTPSTARTDPRPSRPRKTHQGEPLMMTPFNVLDFLDRAEVVYGDRIGVVDEPDQPADSWGEMTWRQVAARARALAAGLDALGVGRSERVAIVSQNSARLFVALFGVP